MNEYRRNRYRGSITGAMILIAIGVVFLIANLHPNVDAWGILFRYWPLILIFIGVGKIFDSFIFRDGAGAPSSDHVSGVAIAFIALIFVFGLAIWTGHGRSNEFLHDTHAVELLGAKDVTADIQMSAGELTVKGGASRLLDSDFRYREEEGKPSVDYSVSGDHGQLNITQEKEHLHLGTTHNSWLLNFGGTEPLDVKLTMGAGQSDLNFRGLDLRHLDVNIGAGQMTLDLTGPRKSDLEVDIEGGVGSATIRLPKDVGVRVHASGGIGSIETDGLKRDGDAYVNGAYGKSPTSIAIEIHGGIGEIGLQLQ
jgi:N-terminal domain of toast_rack, DUF2154/Domain of unknown function (DUF5668)